VTTEQIMGAPLKRREDQRFITGKGRYLDDIQMPGMTDMADLPPHFWGEPDLPHLRYFTSGPDLATHLAGWKKFGPDPRWQKMRTDPRYADNTSKNTARFLTPKPYSQI